MNMKVVGAELVRKGLEDLSQEIPRISRQRIYMTLTRARNILRKPAPRPSYPINWDSEKQRRFVLAMLRKRGGLPYRRSGKYQKGWNVAKAGNMAYTLTNDTPGAEFIGGDFIGRWQSRVHQSRWPVANDVLADEIDTLPNEIENNIASEARRMFA